jgi:hypothetical protein
VGWLCGALLLVAGCASGSTAAAAGTGSSGTTAGSGFVASTGAGLLSQTDPSDIANTSPGADATQRALNTTFDNDSEAEKAAFCKGCEKNQAKQLAAFTAHVSYPADQAVVERFFSVNCAML